MKRILFISNKVTNIVFFRIEIIEGLLESGFEVLVATPEDGADSFVRLLTDIGVTHTSIALNRRGVNPIEDFFLFLNMKKLIKLVKPDLILTYTIKPNIYGNIIARKYNIPVISNITGIGFSLSESYFKVFYKYLYGISCKSANYIFFQNRANLQFFEKNNMIGNTKTILIPGSGVNISKFMPLDKISMNAKLRFLFIGRLMREKGVDELFVAAENIIKKYSNVEFQIVGGVEEERYKNIMSERNYIDFVGRSQDVRVQIREADCIINPSYHEGMSNVLLEGAAMGKPLLASDVAGCREIVEDGYNGFLFESKSASSLEGSIEKFIELPEDERAAMGINSRAKIVSEFNRKYVIDEYMRVINILLN